MRYTSTSKPSYARNLILGRGERWGLIISGHFGCVTDSVNLRLVRLSTQTKPSPNKSPDLGSHSGVCLGWVEREPSYVVFHLKVGVAMCLGAGR
jgi:hypothetical protein